MTIEYFVRNKFYTGYTKWQRPRFYIRRVEGKTYSLGGKLIELFPLRIVAESLADKDSRTILEWEERGDFPKPLFHREIDKERLRRWYSGEQIINMHRIWMGRYGAKLKILSKEETKRFFEDIRSVFYMKDILVDYNGNISTKPVAGTPRLPDALKGCQVDHLTKGV